MMYGYTMVPLDENEDISDDKNHLMNLKMYVTGKFRYLKSKLNEE